MKRRCSLLGSLQTNLIAMGQTCQVNVKLRMGKYPMVNFSSTLSKDWITNEVMKIVSRESYPHCVGGFLRTKRKCMEKKYLILV